MEMKSYYFPLYTFQDDLLIFTSSHLKQIFIHGTQPSHEEPPWEQRDDDPTPGTGAAEALPSTPEVEKPHWNNQTPRAIRTP